MGSILEHPDVGIGRISRNARGFLEVTWERVGMMTGGRGKIRGGHGSPQVENVENVGMGSILGQADVGRGRISRNARGFLGAIWEGRAR